MKKLNLIITTLLLSGLFSCTKDDTMTYGDLNYIYLEMERDSYGEVVDEVPSKYFTFMFEEDATVTEKILELPVLVTGKFAEYDRLFSIKVVDSLTTAVEGTHYTIDPAGQIIPANATRGNISIKLLKTEDLAATEYNLGIKIIDNDFFTARMSTVMKVRFSNFLAEPDWWYTGAWDEPSLGVFTQVKCLLWLEFMGITDGSDPWDIEPYITPYDRPFMPLRKLSKQSFIKWLEVSPGAPYYDENGELVLHTIDT